MRDGNSIQEYRQCNKATVKSWLTVEACKIRSERNFKNLFYNSPLVKSFEITKFVSAFGRVMGSNISLEAINVFKYYE